MAGQLVGPALRRAREPLLSLRAAYARKAERGPDTREMKFIKALEVDRASEDIKYSEEDQREYMQRQKEYSRLKMQQHREWQKRLSVKGDLIRAALAALPPHLRETAAVPDYTPFPLNRQIFTHTPPIPNFQERQTAGRRAAGSRR